MKLRGLAILLPALVGLAATAAHGSRTRLYNNPNWGYSVTVPAGMRYATSRPPAPNHGFRVALSRQAFAWVDGGTSNDESLPAASETEARLWTAQGCRLIASGSATLGGRPAKRIVMRCPAGEERRVPGIISLVIALEAPPGTSNANYVVGAFYPENGPDERRAIAALDAIARGFRFNR